MSKLKVYRLTSNTQFAFTAVGDAGFPPQTQETKTKTVFESIFQINVCISREKL